MIPRAFLHSGLGLFLFGRSCLRRWHHPAYLQQLGRSERRGEDVVSSLSQT